MKKNIRINKATANTGALDFSWLLDAPAGKHGFVRVKDGHLYYDNGKRAKFVGFNFPVRSNMPTKEAAEKISQKLATLGVNVVRLHAADAPSAESGWTTNAGRPLIDYTDGTSRNLNETGLDHFDYWIKCLRDKGIYIHVDLLVARAFLDGDELDYPDSPSWHKKGITHFNRRLIELQKEFATKLLTHVNPYTGLALIDDPSVMTIQIINEDSVFYESYNNKARSGAEPYWEELRKRFNHFLLAKYNTRDNLAKAWTFEGKCALMPDEDPEKQSVGIIEPGNMAQQVNDPMGDWMAFDSPARYAEYVEFGMMINRLYYGEVLEHIRSLGSKVPLVTTNLFTGAADVFSADGGEIMENNHYFNHPRRGPRPEYIFTPDYGEYIKTDPRDSAVKGDDDSRTNLTVRGSTAYVRDKPIIISEWNEYGLNPFHSSAFLMTAAYACLNDLDGLCIYSYTDHDGLDDQPEDTIKNIMSAYNDPSLITIFGTMSAMFLQGLVSPAHHEAEVVYTENDLKTLPPKYRLPNSIFPFIFKMRNVLMRDGNVYDGRADLAISAGFLSGGDFRQSKKAIIYARSPYYDAQRHTYAGPAYLNEYTKDFTEELEGVAKLSDKYLVFDDITSLIEETGFYKFARLTDIALKKWKIIGPDRGIVGNDTIVSDTGELRFNATAGTFYTHTPSLAVFSGAPPKEQVILSDRFIADSRNNRITLTLIPLDGSVLDASKHLLLSAVGESGNDETVHMWAENGRDIEIELKGKLYMDTLEGGLTIKDCKAASIWVLDLYGNRTGEVKGTTQGDDVIFDFDGSFESANFEICIT